MWVNISKVFESTNQSTAKWNKRIKRSEDLFGYVEGHSELHNTAILQASIHNEIMQKIEYETLYEAIRELTETQKRRLYDYYYLDLTIAEIALKEGVSKQQISKSLKQARRKLKKFYK